MSWLSSLIAPLLARLSPMLHWPRVAVISDRQLIQKRSRRNQIGGPEALGKPAMDRCQQVVRIANPALVLPKPCQAGRRPQLPGQRALLAGEGQRSPEPGLRGRGVQGTRSAPD